MDKSDLLRALSSLRVDYLRCHLRESPYSALEEWWRTLVRDSRKCPLLRHQAKVLFYSLWCAAMGRSDLEADVWECYVYLCKTRGSLEDIPWPIIEEALGLCRRQRAHG
jgi:hypothetical protein